MGVKPYGSGCPRAGGSSVQFTVVLLLVQLSRQVPSTSLASRRTNDKMTTAVPILERGLTAVALNDYLKSEPRIAELDGTLGAGVDGDLLIDVIKDRGSPDALALVPFFLGEAVNIGLLGKVAMKLHPLRQAGGRGSEAQEAPRRREVRRTYCQEQNAPREPRSSTTRADDGAVPESDGYPIR